MNATWVTVSASAIALSTVLGGVLGLLLRRVPHRYNDITLGGAAGVMLGAAILGLLVPSSLLPGRFTLPMVATGVAAGAVLVSLLDRITPHLHHLTGLDGEHHAGNRGVNRILLFVTAIATHKLPEGLAAGVSFGTNNPGDIITVVGSITLQNIPEAMVVVAPLLSIGVSMRRTLLISLGIGLVSMTGTFMGSQLVHFSTAAMPFLLAFAGGAMLYVISDEMIPETHSHGYEKPATFSLLAGFLLVLIAQRLFA